jgi:signal peptide peptidase SppA
MDHHSLESLHGAPWAISPNRLPFLRPLLMRGSGNSSTMRATSAIEHPAHTATGAVAVLRLYGTLVPRASDFAEKFGLLGVERFSQSLRAALTDDSIRGIVIDIDSFGGSIHGIQELSDLIFHARRNKPIFAVANSTAASAAYWIGSSASEFYVTPGGEVGSIGVYMVHENLSKAHDKAGVSTTLIHAGKYKVEGSPFAPLSDAAKRHMQSQVDDHYDRFTGGVVRNRNADVATVRNGMGQGRVLGAQSALAEGLVDGIATFSQVLGKMERRVGQPTTGDTAILRLIN